MGDLDFLNGIRWRGELILNMPDRRRSYGFFNRGELKLGSEASTVDDPEDGMGIPAGGKQTADPLPISRPWKHGRDDVFFDEVHPLRNRVRGSFPIWELDEHGDAYSSEPLITLDVLVLEVGLPPGEAGDNDSSVASVELQVRP